MPGKTRAQFAAKKRPQRARHRERDRDRKRRRAQQMPASLQQELGESGARTELRRRWRQRHRDRLSSETPQQRRQRRRARAACKHRSLRAASEREALKEKAAYEWDHFRAGCDLRGGLLENACLLAAHDRWEDDREQRGLPRRTVEESVRSGEFGVIGPFREYGTTKR
eukprot:gene48120-17213_t